MAVNKADKPMIKKNVPVFQVGYWVAVVVKEAPVRPTCFIGEVSATDERGMRITLMDFLMGMFCGSDAYIPWESIAFSYVGTEEDSFQGWMESAIRLQNRVNHDGDEPKESKEPEPYQEPRKLKFLTLDELED